MPIEKGPTKRIESLSILVFVLLDAILLTLLLRRTGSLTLLLYGGILSLFCLLWMLLFMFLLRGQLTRFADSISQNLDGMLVGNLPPINVDEDETLLAKIHHGLLQLYEVLQANRKKAAAEKAALQELITDISHQVKTPIANLKMVNATLLEQEMPADKQKDFLAASITQLDKLDFLMQAMIKTSRLETGIIVPQKQQQALYDTLAIALGGIFLSAEQKQIDVTVDCPEDLKLPHDRKWTAEALFNLLDNAVKYTEAGGSIHVLVERMEVYSRISIRDTGKGIAENHQAEIFKRFYREDTVQETEGIGVGLFLAREIVSLQGGYIKVTSALGQGATFSVFLPNEL